MENSCPHCKAALAPDARFCPMCSAAVTDVPTLVRNDSAPNQAAQTFATQSSTYTTQFSTQARACPKCWAQLGANATFCGNCGTTIGRLSRKTKIVIAAAAVGLALIVGSIIFFFGGSSGSGLFPIVQNGKWGYMDKHGKVVINPQFDSHNGAAGFFSEGLALVSIGRKFGYINTKGEFVINPQFEYASPFSEGLAAIVTGDTRENNKLGYIDKNGKTAIVPQYDAEFRESWMASFSDGLAPVGIGHSIGYIDKTGKIIISPQFREGFPFSDGLAVVRVGDKWGYIDKTGKIIINPQFNAAWPFTEGLGLVEVEGKWGFVDKTGKIVINPQFERATPFSDEGIAGVEIGNKWGGIDTTGKVVINPQFDEFSSSFGGRLGGQIISGDFSNIFKHYFFSEGLAGVRVGNKYGYIDKTGKYVINPQFDQAFPFNEGLAMVVIREKSIGNSNSNTASEYTEKLGYIDKSGKYVWNPTN